MACRALFLRARWAGPRIQEGVLSIPHPLSSPRLNKEARKETQCTETHTYRTGRLEEQKKEAQEPEPDKGRAMARGVGSGVARWGRGRSRGGASTGQHRPREVPRLRSGNPRTRARQAPWGPRGGA